MAYVAQAEHLEPKALKEFDVNLPLPPGVTKGVSHGTDKLLALYDSAKANG